MKKKKHIVTLKESTYNNLKILKTIASNEADSRISFDTIIRTNLQKNGKWTMSKNIRKKMKELAIDTEEDE